jgi:putative PIN family toxin of toxin-antitoxin system
MDISTLVSAALRPGSVPALAFARALASYEVCVSAATLAELVEVMRRPKFDRYLPLPDREDLVAVVRQHGRSFDVPDLMVQGITECRDAKDVKFLALALACEALVLVSSDQDLLCLQPFRGVEVLAPTAFRPTKFLVELDETPTRGRVGKQTINACRPAVHRATNVIQAWRTKPPPRVDTMLSVWSTGTSDTARDPARPVSGGC